MQSFKPPFTLHLFVTVCSTVHCFNEVLGVTESDIHTSNVASEKSLTFSLEIRGSHSSWCTVEISNNFLWTNLLGKKDINHTLSSLFLRGLSAQPSWRPEAEHHHGNGGSERRAHVCHHRRPATSNHLETQQPCPQHAGAGRHKREWRAPFTLFHLRHALLLSSRVCVCTSHLESVSISYLFKAAESKWRHFQANKLTHKCKRTFNSGLVLKWFDMVWDHSMFNLIHFISLNVPSAWFN